MIHLRQFLFFLPIRPLLALLISLSCSHAATELVTIKNCVLLPTEWADGDSFFVRTPDRQEFTVRLYGADCVEMHVNDATDERRLREQRRYFGISSIAPNVPQSISEAKNFGKLAKDFVNTALAKPFTIHTAFSDARGDSKHKRVYAFVVTHDGKDLAEELTAAGLARAFGITRLTFDQRSADEYREHLRDLELRAAIAKTGIWAKTNVKTLSDERLAQRREDEELKIAIGNGKVEEGGAKININQANLDDLLKLPSVGEVTAKNIIAARPFQKATDLSKVKGIGPATLKKLLPLVEVH